MNPAAMGRCAARGFTLVEVLVGGAVAMIGLYATLNLAVEAARGNTERRDAQIAGQLAEHVLATMQAEAVMWKDDAPAPISRYLNKISTPATVGAGTPWLNGPGAPLANDRRVGQLGADQTYDQGALQEVPNDRGQRFCVHYRLTWVSSDVMRAEVRVSWARANAPVDAYKQCPVSMITNPGDIGYVGSVTLPALVMRNVYAQ
ncbi:MAG: prepilin-type N-terminal cleavage/methylation domain-containing protein [Deltaproteobacteria bacterium]|nr:prepilin-type N-terminal cleavage/methylation domain-containing protein [Deltaproteobacteria bacterium]